MKHLAILLTFLATATAAFAQWQPDVLGDGFEMRHVDQGTDYSGPVRSTIIRKTAPGHPDRGVLYVHGFNDYFFQTEMADRFVDSCYSFYAVDLRKYGRSLMKGQRMFQVHNMREYFPDIDSAIVQMKHDGIDNIILLGHSTGGLTTSLYMSECADPAIKALVLNSPFLDWNLSPFLEHFGVPAVVTIEPLIPNLKISQGSSTGYSHSLLRQYGGEWTYDTDWKLEVSPDVDAAWVKAIQDAQVDLQYGRKILVPILLMHSARSVKPGDGPEAYSQCDAVLDVNDIAHYGSHIGIDITELTVSGGLHDLVLSRPVVRNALYQHLFGWINRLYL